MPRHLQLILQHRSPRPSARGLAECLMRRQAFDRQAGVSFDLRAWQDDTQMLAA